MFQKTRNSIISWKNNEAQSSRIRSQSVSPLSSGALNFKVFNIVYSNLVEQILEYYCSEQFVDTPMIIQFIYKNNEVNRKTSFEMFTTFWEFTFEKYFIGNNGSFVPRVELNGDSLNMMQSTGIGKIISHGFYLTGYLPINGICKASLLYCLTGLIPSDNILLESYLKSIEENDREIIEEALIFINTRNLFNSKSFPKQLENDLMEFFHESGLKAIPRIDNLKNLLLKSARFYCIEKPFYVLANIRKGVVQLNPHWENLKEDMALVFMENCHNTGQCQPNFFDESTELSDVDDFCNRSVRSSFSSNSLFKRN